MESLRRELTVVGLSPYEADVYLALLQESPANGSQVARRSGVPRSMVYQTLDRLVEKGAVLLAQGEVALYAPVPPGEFLGRLKSSFAAACDLLSRALPAMAAARAEGELAWILKGWDAVRERAAAMAQRAGGRLLAGGDPAVIAALVPELVALRPGARPGQGVGALVDPGAAALLVHLSPGDEPSAVYSRHPAAVAAASALARELPANRRPPRLAIPDRPIW